ncbi:hypothetical protein NRIC_04130 [Enterococcus florum]|uniref:Uncharacterized protein n=1 Tax=Enterococcus florum TaxID=2480627 RepID=A0A4P5PAJ9_9ENTE|nr:hypothetical protein NRIC_04130 [Enterococcus florum]
MKIECNLTEIREYLYTFKDASLKLEKQPNYFNQMFKRHPDWFHKDTIMHIGRENIISQEGIDYYVKKAKLRNPKKPSTD